MSEAHKAQLVNALRVLDAILDVIKSAGDNGVPSGFVYAALMGSMSLETYERMIGLLIEAKRVRRSHDVLYYVKP